MIIKGKEGIIYCVLVGINDDWLGQEHVLLFTIFQYTYQIHIQYNKYYSDDKINSKTKLYVCSLM